VKRASLFLALMVAGVALITTSCGTSDYLQSITLSATGANSGSFYNLVGLDGTVQFLVTANYHSGKTIPVTNSVTWSVTPNLVDDNGVSLPPYGPTTVPISATGLMTGIVSICTWTDAIVTTGSTTGPANPPIWEYTGYYQVTATYKGFTSQPIGIGVGVAASNNSPIGGCGPA